MRAWLQVESSSSGLLHELGLVLGTVSHSSGTSRHMGHALFTAEVGGALRGEWKHVMSLEDKACNRFSAVLAQIPFAKTGHEATPTKSRVGK